MRMKSNASLSEMDRDLAFLLKQGSEEAYHKIYNKYAPAVLGVLTRTLKVPLEELREKMITTIKKLKGPILG